MTNAEKKPLKLIIYIITIAICSLLFMGRIFLKEEMVLLKKEEHRDKQNIIEIEKSDLKGNLSRIKQQIDYLSSEKKEFLKQTLKDRVYDAYKIIDTLYKENRKHNKQQISKEMIARLKSIRFNDNSEYYFIIDMDGRTILTPGTDIKNATSTSTIGSSPDATRLIAEMIDVIKFNKEDFFTYSWPRPGQDPKKMYPKISYLKFFEPLKIFIGAGEYLDTLEDNTRKDILYRIQNHNSKSVKKISVLDERNQPLGYDVKSDSVLLQYIKDDPDLLKHLNSKDVFINTNLNIIIMQENIVRWKWKIVTYSKLDSLASLLQEREQNSKDKLNYYLIIIIITFLILMTLICWPLYNYFKAHKGMQRLTRQFISIVEHSGDPIISINNDQNIISWNQAATGLFGYEEKTMMNRPINLLFPSLQSFNSIKVMQHELLAHHKDGGAIPVVVTESPIKGNHYLEYNRALIIHDITQEKRRENELIVARKEAEMANQAKNLFLTNMGHEIRTPMNAILGFSEVLRESIKGDQEIEYLGIIQKNAQKLVGIIDDILDMAKLEMGSIDIGRTPFNFDLILKEIEHKIYEKIGSRPIEFKTEYNIQNIYQYQGDAFRLKQILLHVLENAVKFTERGSVCFSVRFYEHENPLKGNVEFIIKDTGIGIDSDYIQKKIYSPFTQVDETHTRKFGGVGLGLSIVKNIVENMQGTVDIRGEKGVGTTVIISLPLDLLHPV